jgi:hypothetical protein
VKSTEWLLIDFKALLSTTKPRVERSVSFSINALCNAIDLGYSADASNDRLTILAIPSEVNPSTDKEERKATSDERWANVP